MENYEGEPSEIEHWVDANPFLEAPQYFHIEVPKEKGARAMVRDKVLKVFGPGKPIVLYGAGKAVTTVVSCAEIIKTYFKQPIFQTTRLGQIKTSEVWKAVAANLDDLRVIRKIPMVYICLSLEQLDDKELGYQKCITKRREIKTLTLSALSNMLNEDDCSSPSSESPVSPQPQTPDFG